VAADRNAMMLPAASSSGFRKIIFGFRSPAMRRATWRSVFDPARPTGLARRLRVPDRVQVDFAGGTDRSQPRSAHWQADRDQLGWLRRFGQMYLVRIRNSDWLERRFRETDWPRWKTSAVISRADFAVCLYREGSQGRLPRVGDVRAAVDYPTQKRLLTGRNAAGEVASRLSGGSSPRSRGTT
jgi:hypothetical protein